MHVGKLFFFVLFLKIAVVAVEVTPKVYQRANLKSNKIRELKNSSVPHVYSPPSPITKALLIIELRSRCCRQVEFRLITRINQYCVLVSSV